MKRLGLAIAVGLIAAPAMATDLDVVPALPAHAWQAHVDFYGGGGRFNTETYNVLGGAGRANLPFANAWNLQLDLQGYRLITPAFFVDGNALEGYAHVYKRTDVSAYGAFAGVQRDRLSSGGHDILTAGIEGQRYWANTTFYAQASLSRIESACCGYSINAAMLRGELRHFLSDNTMVAGDAILTYGRGAAVDGSFNVLSVALTAMHRFEGTHFGIWGQGRYDRYSFYSGSSSSDQWMGLLGLRLFCDPDGSTLRSHFGTGPAMDVLPLPLYWGRSII